MLTQTLAIFYDAYRALRARKMFWIVLGLSGLVVGGLAAVGIDADGVKILAWRVSSVPNTHGVSAAVFHKSLFTSLGLSLWLSWIAAILALISTAGIFPELMAGGSIDLVLCKPIGRVRLFLTQYASGLLFVLLQVLVFCVAGFLVIGFRGGAWEVGLFVAVPLVVCFFSYLFAVCVFWGLVTRSTVAAILLTLLVWFLIWGLHTAESATLLIEVSTKQKIARVERGIQFLQTRADALEQGRTESAPGGDPSLLRDRADGLREMRASDLESLETLRTVHKVLYGVKTFLPKTTETVALTERLLIRMADLPPPPPEKPISLQDDFGLADRGQAAAAVARQIRTRSTAWVIGTSLAFEAVLLALCAWIFRRRDF